MPRVAQQRAVLHALHGGFRDDVAAARHRDEQVADLCRLFHGHDGKAVHDRLHRLDRVYLGDHDLCAEPLCAHSDALAAPAVARDHHGFARDDQIRCAVDAVKDRLPRAVTVVEQVFAFGIVDRHHREAELFFLCHGGEPQDACGRFLTAADHVAEQLRVLVVQEVHKVAAVINDEVRTA